MRKKQIAGSLVLIAALLVFWGGVRYFSGAERVEGEFSITAFSVGKADALLINKGDFAALIDAGEKDDGEALAAELARRGIDSLDYLIITDFDKDHVGGAAKIVSSVETETVLMPDYEGGREEYQEFLQALEGHPDVRRVTAPCSFTEEEVSCLILPAEDPLALTDTDKEYDNDLSLVSSISYGNRKFLLTGDIEKARIGQMLETDTDWKHDWIKLPHHGRYHKQLPALLEAVSPVAAVICTSPEETAEEKTLELLKRMNISVWNTERNAVVTVSDGERIEVRYE